MNPPLHGTGAAPGVPASKRPSRVWRIGTDADDLREGLFGQAVLWVCEVLPALERLGVAPQWDIRSRLYASAPDFRIIPGVLEPAGTVAATPSRSCSLMALRTRHASVLGNDWQALHALWSRHFRVPRRVEAMADGVALPAGALGIHFRGTDKNQATAETNPVAPADLLSLVDEFLDAHPDVPALFIASDEYGFVEAAQRRFTHLPVHNLGPVAFHKEALVHEGKADRAMLDCVLLSRCAHLLKSSSALSAFAKVLNPELSAHRVAASKVFFGGIPYFPDAYIPPLQGRSDATRAILARQLAGDWLEDAQLAARFRPRFTSVPRYNAAQAAVNSAKYALSVALGRTRIA